MAVKVILPYYVYAYFTEKLGEPYEIGGLLLTLEKDEEVFFPLGVVPEQRRGRSSFLFTAEAQFHVCEAIRSVLGEQSLSLVHTHPSIPAFLSGTDVEIAPMLLYSIVVGGKPDKPDIKVFRGAEEVSFELELWSLNSILEGIGDEEFKGKLRELLERFILLRSWGYVLDVLAPGDLVLEVEHQLITGISALKDLRASLEKEFGCLRTEIEAIRRLLDALSTKIEGLKEELSSLGGSLRKPVSPGP